MTNQEAITKLTNIMHDDLYAWHPSILEAFRMAVDALKGADGDCISRVDAIKAVHDEFDGCLVWDESGERTADEVELILDRVPSAQPEQRWIPWDSGEFPKESGTYTVTTYDGVTKRVTFAKYQKRLKRWELTGARAYWRVLAWMPLPECYKGEGEADD